MLVCSRRREEAYIKICQAWSTNSRRSEGIVLERATDYIIGAQKRYHDRMNWTWFIWSSVMYYFVPRRKKKLPHSRRHKFFWTDSLDTKDKSRSKVNVMHKLPTIRSYYNSTKKSTRKLRRKNKQHGRNFMSTIADETPSERQHLAYG